MKIECVVNNSLVSNSTGEVGIQEFSKGSFLDILKDISEWSQEQNKEQSSEYIGAPQLHFLISAANNKISVEMQNNKEEIKTDQKEDGENNIRDKFAQNLESSCFSIFLITNHVNNNSENNEKSTQDVENDGSSNNVIIPQNSLSLTNTIQVSKNETDNSLVTDKQVNIKYESDNLKKVSTMKGNIENGNKELNKVLPEHIDVNKDISLEYFLGKEEPINNNEDNLFKHERYNVSSVYFNNKLEKCEGTDTPTSYDTFRNRDGDGKDFFSMEEKHEKDKKVHLVNSETFIENIKRENNINDRVERQDAKLLEQTLATEDKFVIKKENNHSVSMIIDSKEAGKVKVNLTINDGVVKAEIFPNSEQARHYFRENIEKLATALGNDGINLGSFVLKDEREKGQEHKQLDYEEVYSSAETNKEKGIITLIAPNKNSRLSLYV